MLVWSHVWDMLSRNLFNVVESNEHHVLFRKEGGSYHKL